MTEAEFHQLHGVAAFSRVQQQTQSVIQPPQPSQQQQVSRFITPFMTFFLNSTDAPEAFGITGALMALSTVLLGRKTLNVGAGIKPNLYAMLTGPSTAPRKSTSVVFAQRMVQLVEQDYVGPRDYTAEGLLKWMSGTNASKQKRTAFTLFSEEYGADLARREAYGATLDGDLCALYDGNSFTKVRAKASDLTIENPRVSLFAACAYNFIERYLTARDWSSGLLMRFLFISPGQMRPEMLVQPKEQPHLFDAAVNGLAAVRDQARAFPQALELTPAAEQLYSLAAASYRAQSMAFDDPVMSIYLGRLGPMILKVATLFQCDVDATLPVSYSAMEAAVNFIWCNALSGFMTTFDLTTRQDELTIGRKISMMARQPGGVPKLQLAEHFGGSAQYVGTLATLLSSGLVKMGFDSKGVSRLYWHHGVTLP